MPATTTKFWYGWDGVRRLPLRFASAESICKWLAGGTVWERQATTADNPNVRRVKLWTADPLGYEVGLCQKMADIQD